MNKSNNLRTVLLSAIISTMLLYVMIYISSQFIFIKDHKNNLQTHTRDVYICRLESKYSAAREALAEEVDNYINNVAPTAIIDALTLIDLCSEYNVDIRFVLAQGHIESHFGTKGMASRTNSVFNVGAYDGISVEQQKRNGFGYIHPDYSIEPYLKLLVNNYLVDNKSEMDLMENFVNANGDRYASNPEYEKMLYQKYLDISDSNISQIYDIYKMYRLQLGI